MALGDERSFRCVGEKKVHAGVSLGPNFHVFRASLEAARAELADHRSCDVFLSPRQVGLFSLLAAYPPVF